LYGPLKGFQGRVKQKNSKTKLVVWLDAIAQGVSVEIDPRFLSVCKKNKLMQFANSNQRIVSSY